MSTTSVITISRADNPAPVSKSSTQSLGRRLFSWGKPDFLSGLALVTIALMGLPIIALCVIAASGDLHSLSHIARTILPRAGLTTILLLAGLAIVAGSIGAITAWLVSFYDFPGRRIFRWALVLPLAVPTYISAYSFTEFFTFTGPIQSLVRQIGGYSLARDYWFPDIRSLPGAVLVLSLVLYPYVYLSMVGLFRYQGQRILEAAMLLGAGPRRALTQVLIPLARPALALGVILAMMEAINDIGAIEFLGVRTLTYAVFSTWLNQNDMAGAAQIALVLLAVVVLLMLAERLARKGQVYSGQRDGSGVEPFELQKISGGWAGLATLACLLPLLLGFGVPFLVLGNYALRYVQDGLDERLLEALWTSLGLASVAAVIAVVAALTISYAVRVKDTPAMRVLVRIASSGYAIPGTIIALGIFLPLARFDNFVDGWMRELFGFSTGLLITGSGATLIYAYVVRFMAVAEGSISGGFKKLSPNLDEAAYIYGRGRLRTLIEILLPLMKPAILVAGLFVFIDVLKELSATLILRPFGLETLAVYIHDLASRGRVEQAGFACMVIMLAGIIPAILLSRLALGDRHEK